MRTAELGWSTEGRTANNNSHGDVRRVHSNTQTPDIEAGNNYLRNRKDTNDTSSSSSSTPLRSSTLSDSTKRLIRNLSIQMVEEKQLSIDEERLKKAVQDAGQYAYGIAAVEVWVLDDESGRLVRPSHNNGGASSSWWWRDDSLPSTQALTCLESSSNENVEIMPGVCLAGVLFAESTRVNKDPEPAVETRSSHRRNLTQYFQKHKSPGASPLAPSHRKSPSLAFWQKLSSSPSPTTATDFQFDFSNPDILHGSVTAYEQLPAESSIKGLSVVTTEGSPTSPSKDIGLGSEQALASFLALPSTRESSHSKRLYWKTHKSTATAASVEEESPAQETILENSTSCDQPPSTLSLMTNEAINTNENIPWDEISKKPQQMEASTTITFEEKLHPQEKIFLNNAEFLKLLSPANEASTAFSYVNEDNNDLNCSGLSLQGNLSGSSNVENESNVETVNSRAKFPRSSLKFPLEKIFEDQTESSSTILPQTDHETIKELPPAVTHLPSISPHRKSKSFHVGGGGLESLKELFVSTNYGQAESHFETNTRQTTNEQPAGLYSGSTTLPSHRKTKSLYWQQEPLPADVPSFHILDCLKPLQEELHSSPNHLLHFRDIKSLLYDPDTAKTPRLALLHEAGFSHAAGVPFQSGGMEGIVIYFTTRHTTINTAAAVIDPNTANLVEGGTMSIANQVYLLRATELIGAVVASIEARRAVMVMKLESSTTPSSATSIASSESVCTEHWKTAKTDLSATTDQKGNKTLVGFSIGKVRKDFKVWRNKCRGGNLQIPPAMPWEQCSWTFAGVFISILLLSGLNRAIVALSEGKYFIMGAPIMGPIGSVIALQYGSTSAPTAQPRNIILGQLVACAVVLPFTYIPVWILSQWIRQAIATACAITALVKLGIFHPPAGGAALVFSSGAFNLGLYLIMVSSCALFVIVATMINNFSKKRQYPTYWM